MVKKNSIKMFFSATDLENFKETEELYENILTQLKEINDQART